MSQVISLEYQLQNAQSVPPWVTGTLEAAKKSVVSIILKVISINKTAKFLFRHQHAQEWNNTLDELGVQSKFKDVVMLEEENKMWHYLLANLPAGQLSILILVVGNAAQTQPTCYVDQDNQLHSTP